MVEFVAAVLVAGILLAIGFGASQWLHTRFKFNEIEQRNKAFQQAFVEAQRKIQEDFNRQNRLRQERENDETNMTGEEEIKTYEESLRNLYPDKTEEEIAQMLKERRRI